MKRCGHPEWEEIRRAFTPPPQWGFEVDRISEDGLQQLVFGITTVELRCVGCRDVKAVVMPGKVGAG